MATTTMARYQFNLNDTTHVAAAWSAIAGPGDKWAGRLRAVLGDRDALQWALSPYKALAHITGPGDANPNEWKTAWQRWNMNTLNLNTPRDLETLHSLGGRLLTPTCEEWPTQLTDLGYAMPPALWVLGQSPVTTPTHRTVTVTGSRAATAYGVQITRAITSDLATKGITIASGGGYGIEATAHHSAINNQDSKALATPTIAIVCGGLKDLYPAGNANLFAEILQRGGNIIAEVPPTYRPARWRYLERNRLLAAWSALTIIPEAGVRSGAMAAAHQSARLNRHVAAMPGPITSPASSGPNELIRQGQAHLVTITEQAASLLN